jgi:VIT1/CCC1 family predicted Fe2+/Mn2+ transporter
VWSAKLAELGRPASASPSWRARTLAALARRGGAGLVLPTLIEGETQGGSGYSGVPGAERMAGQESGHKRLLEAMSASKTGAPGAAIAALEGRHRGGGGNALRAAVLGANDGLVSNMSLVMGVAGAAMTSSQILVTGLAGLLAGAISMALGEWLSVQSSRELFQRQLAIEAAELESAPEEEALELALIYEAKGMSKTDAERLANQVVSTPASALDTLAREELGVDPESLGGSAWEAAAASFVLFAVGAIIPVVPFFGLEGSSAVTLSLLLSAAGLFVLGAAITLFTGRGIGYSGVRQMIFGLVAAAVTYGIGRLVGATLVG